MIKENFIVEIPFQNQSSPSEQNIPTEPSKNNFTKIVIIVVSIIVIVAIIGIGIYIWRYIDSGDLDKHYIIYDYSNEDSEQEQLKETDFALLATKEYSSDLSLEKAYKIVLPYVKKWDSEVFLEEYMTNIPTTDKNYKVHLFVFISINRLKKIYLGFNYNVGKLGMKYPENSYLDYTDNYELTNKFSVLESERNTYFDSMLESQKEEYLAKAKAAMERSNFNRLNKMLDSDEILELAYEEGLQEFLDKHKDLYIVRNSIKIVQYLSEDNPTEDEFKWAATVYVGKEMAFRPSSGYVDSFIVQFDSFTGEKL